LGTGGFNNGQVTKIVSDTNNNALVHTVVNEASETNEGQDTFSFNQSNSSVNKFNQDLHSPQQQLVIPSLPSVQME